jgi:hypothetical protein
MGIGIDFDGTMADTNTAKSAWIRRELGRDVPPYACDHTCCAALIGEAEYARMSVEVYGRESTLRLSPVLGALAVIAQLRESRRVLVMTARTGEMLESARLWLSRHPETDGLEALGVPTGEMTKGEACVARGVGALVDDDERHLLSAAALGIQSLLFKPAAPPSLRVEGVRVCRSWEEIRQALTGL